LPFIFDAVCDLWHDERFRTMIAFPATQNRCEIGQVSAGKQGQE
jgi:hypothetical protein